MSNVNGASKSEIREARLAQGTIRYRDMGAGDPIVLVHGLLTNGELWREVAPALAADFRVIVPDWPLGSQELPLAPGADLSPPALARLIADFIAALDLEGVTLVGNDTGGALCQLVAVNHGERIGRLVLTPCDAFEHFPPPAFQPLVNAAKVPGAVFAIMQSMRAPAARRMPMAYGWLMKRYDSALTAKWVAPGLASRGLREQIATILKGFSPSHTLAAAERFGEFTKPVLIAWAPEDRFFKLANAERLRDAFPDARLERIEDSYTYVMIDQPERTAQLIAEFARQPIAAR
jgi:pimeloyl-ACP methyl ester carboxylesterase